VTFLGYREVRDTLPVGPGADLDLSLSMSVSPIRLDPIVVVSDRKDLGIMGDFERRRRVRSGTFFDRDDIEARNPYRFSDLLRMVPGARVVSRGLSGNTVRLRGNCTPALWVDGVRLMTIEGMDDLLPTMDIEAVEVYHGVSLPVQFGSNPCGGILVWTRIGERGEGGGSFWKRLGIAVVLGMLAILATR
jgi:outer membrane cobalamin receptor